MTTPLMGRFPGSAIGQTLWKSKNKDEKCSYVYSSCTVCLSEVDRTRTSRRLRSEKGLFVASFYCS
jgi:hypothetical protein